MILKLCSIILSSLLFQKNTQILKFFLPLPWPHYNLWKVLMIFECMFLKAVNIRVLLSIESVYLHGYFEWKHKPKHLSEFWWENIHLTWVFLFHIWLSCKLKRLTNVWKKQNFIHLYVHDNMISRRLICFHLYSFFLIHWKYGIKDLRIKFWNCSILPRSAKG